MSELQFVMGVVCVGGAVVLALLTMLLAYALTQRKATVERFRALRFEDVTQQDLPNPGSTNEWMQEFRRLGFRRLGDVRPPKGRPTRLLISADGSTTAYVTERPRSFGMDTWFEDGSAIETSLCGVSSDHVGHELAIHQRKGSIEALLTFHNSKVPGFGANHGNRVHFDTLDAWMAADVEHRNRLAEEHIEAAMKLVGRRLREFGLVAAALGGVGILSIALSGMP